MTALPGPKGSASSVSQAAYSGPSITDWNDLCAIVAAGASTDAGIINVKDTAYGAAGDGVTDDYAAIQLAVAALNAAGRGTLLFPPGTYRVDRYRIDGGEYANGVLDFTFTDLDGFVVSGFGAKLDLKGDFNRPADTDVGGGMFTSFSNSIIPLQFSNCKNGRVEGFEIDQNVDDMTKSSGVVEGTGYAVIITNGCERITVDSLNVHHGATDGISLQAGAGRVACKDITVRNCAFWAQARICGSVIQAQNVLFESCVFTGGGRTDAAGTAAGGYGYHAPGACFDVEPDYTPDTVPAVDVLTSSIVFRNCRFENSQGLLFAAASGERLGSVTIDSCWFDDRDGEGSDYPVILACLDGTLQNSFLAIRALCPTWNDAGTPEKLKTTVRNNYILSDHQAILSSAVVQDVHIDGNALVGSHTAELTTYFPYLQSNTKMRFTNNNIFLPAAAHDGAAHHIAALIQEVQQASGNIYRTDLTTGGLFFATSYTTGEIFDEHYPNPVYFKSDYTAVYDDANYAYGRHSLRRDGYISTTDATVRLFTGDSTASPGDATLGYFAGKSAVALGAAAVTITCPCVAGDIVMITPIDNDATLTSYKAVAGSGSFVLTGNAAATAAWKFGWFILRKGN